MSFYMKKIIFRGPCDITAIYSYLKPKNIIYDTELIGDKIDKVWDTSLSIYLAQLANNVFVNDVFVEKNQYPKADIFDENKIDGVVISILNEGYHGIYKNKINDYEVAYGLWNYDATYKKGYHYLEGEAKGVTGFPRLTKRDYTRFSSEYSFCGRISPEESSINIKRFVDRFSDRVKICIILGPTFPSAFGEKSPAFKDDNSIIFFKKLNDSISDIFNSYKNVFLIRPADYYVKPKKRSDLFYYNYPSIGHYPKKTYKKIAKHICKIFNRKIRYDYHKSFLKFIKKIKMKFIRV